MLNVVLQSRAPASWDSQDERVLLDAEHLAERFSSRAKLAFSVIIGGLLIVLSIVADRWNEWVAIIAVVNIAIAIAGVYLSQLGRFPRTLPWVGLTVDVLLLLGIGLLGPWFGGLPAGMRSALVSPWAAFLFLAVTLLGLNAARVIVQTVLLVVALALLIWWPTYQVTQAPTIPSTIAPLFSDASNITRLSIVLMTGLAMALVASRARQILREAIRTARERTLLERFNSAEVNRYVLSTNVDSLRNGTRQRICVLFADIRGFTSLSEQMDASQVVQILNSFRARVEQAVYSHGGIIDKFIGDGALAIFGIPSPQPQDSTNALRAALTLVASVEKWQEKRVVAGQAPIEIAIGIHSGDAFVGVLGEQQLEFTVIGDTVNVGQRLQAEARNLDATIIVSAEAAKECASVDMSGTKWTQYTGLRLRGRTEVLDVRAYGRTDFQKCQ